ncbi:cytochrome P450 [Neolentinus lepideus HHB14362 ss-1]|uniref:Cytochrome P450 n=1 Tax=Neolentinus lepideus HHB14362 ss-1 TaxID=1314782 RepID=A0A165TUB2_9AGAM|nr:cytochrome P450 [Neolentinus lepideus HHB14362 ss-1]
MSVDLSILAAALVAAVVVVLYRRQKARSISYIRGPKADSFVFGHLRELGSGCTGDVHFKWQDEFGSVVRYKSIFSMDKLMICDPKALQYIFHTSAYNFPKQRATRMMVKTMNGPDLFWSEGDMHKRQRKVMLPAFGAPEARALFPVFKSKIEHLITLWKDMINDTSDGNSITMNIHEWLGRATLDAIGEAAFGYKLGAMDEDSTDLGKMYRNFVMDISPPSRPFTDAIIQRTPTPVLEVLFDHLHSKGFDRLREHKTLVHQVARQLVETKVKALEEGKMEKDVLSLLVKANSSMTSKHRLTEEELYAEMSIILFAGHDTTSNTLAWALWELAKHPEIQDRVRKEIREREADIRARGAPEFTLADIESLPYFQAFLKESMRMHPAVFGLSRVAAKDTIVPLSQPILDTSGRLRQELIIPKGTEISVPLGCYNREKTVWGDDAHSFNPERWMQPNASEKRGTALGVVGNLMTFSSGTRSCIGWRFAMTELQCFLLELVNTFQFRVAHRTLDVQKVGYGIAVPRLRGEGDKGTQLPMTVSIADRD